MRMWKTFTTYGELVVQVPDLVDDFDTEEIEHIFSLIVRGLKRRTNGRPMLATDIDDQL